MPRPVAPLLALAAAAVMLAGCSIAVAPGAPTLLSRDEIALRTAETADQTRGLRAANTLAWRAQRLRENAARIRRRVLADSQR